jgi:hypothetical protein
MGVLLCGKIADAAGPIWHGSQQPPVYRPRQKRKTPELTPLLIANTIISTFTELTKLNSERVLERQT